VPRRLGQLLVVLTLVASLGGHWAMLQTVAWAGMLARNLQRTNLAQAVSDTFDGNHPCAMCKAIKAGRETEQQQEQQQIKPGLKLELGLAQPPASLTLARAREWVAPSDASLTIHREGPPKPRPRLFAPTAFS
jgi:hypothetical protein